MIRVLEDRVINRIAAGEVVERPASVVKELVENALDAGAHDLRIELKAGGRNLVRVADDGCGMDPTDAVQCLERHATSKIRTDADLLEVATLGFRGEAIPSIAAVSRFEIVTRPADAPAGTRVVVEGGRHVNTEAAGCAPGTEVIVRSLFFNVPARRKFMRTVPTELSHCIEAVVRETLVRPDLDVELVHDGNTIVRAPVVADRATRAADLLGPHGEALVSVEFEQGSLRVRALASPVGVHRPSAQGAMYLYVNGRYVRDAVLRRAVSEAYRGIVPKGRFPTVVLEVLIPPDHVDVNVHPAKTEVRFRNPGDLAFAVGEGLREGLQRHGIKRPVAVESRYQPAVAVPPSSSEQVFLPVRQSAGPMFLSEPAPSQTEGAPAPARPELPSERSEWTPPDRGPSAMLPPARPDAAHHRSCSAATDLLPVPRYTDLRVLGQLARTYVLCEGGGELVIVDQHAAHERITLHRLRRAEREHLGGGQRLLTPPIIELAPARARALQDHVDVLARYGLEIEPFGGNSYVVKQVPEALAGVDPTRLVEDVADDFADGGDGRPARELVDHLLATMACHGSVRAGQGLSPYEMRELLRALDEVDFSVCAHGRPVSIRVSPDELERRFHRT